MLPDYPELKKEIKKFMEKWILHRMNTYSPGIAEIPHHTLFEGHELNIVRSSGKEDKTQMFESGGEVEFPFSEVPDMTLDVILQKIDKVAFEMAVSKENNLFGSLHQQLEESGNVVSSPNKKLNAEAILEALDSIMLSFDSQGNPKSLSFHFNPKVMGKAYEKAMHDLKTVPKYKQRLEEIIRKKRAEWNAEEASRKLVG